MPQVTASLLHPRIWLTPRRLLDAVLSPLGYLGGLAILGASAFQSLWRRGECRPRLVPGLTRQLDELFGMGFPLVGLVHVGFGSFLSMQAYYGATFTQANGAVVGLGLIRNVAPLLTAFVLTGLMAVRASADLGGELRPGLDEEAADVPDREVVQGRSEELRTPPDPARLTLVRLLAVVIAGPILILWGALVGIVIGALVSGAVLGLPSSVYFGLFRQLLGPADAVGVVIKGVAYSGTATLIACHEALRFRSRPEGDRTGAPPAYRAVIVGTVAILFLNFCWFNLVYLSGGNPFGPPVLDAGS